MKDGSIQRFDQQCYSYVSEMGREMMNPDGQRGVVAFFRSFGYCLSLLGTWFYMSKVGV